jgi:hypothetical protein
MIDLDVIEKILMPQAQFNSATSALNEQYAKQKLCENGVGNDRLYMVLKQIHPDILCSLNKGYEICWIPLTGVEDLVSGRLDKFTMTTVSHQCGLTKLPIPLLEYVV